MKFETPNEWKMDGMELSLRNKLIDLDNRVKALEDGGSGGGSSDGISTVHFTTFELNQDPVTGATSPYYASAEPASQVLAELEAGKPQVWIFPAVPNTGFATETPFWFLVGGIYYEEVWGEGDHYETIIRIAFTYVNNPLNEMDIDFSGDHVIAPLYVD